MTTSSLARGRSALLVTLFAVPFTLSGASALIFQSVLNKHFAFIFGVSSYATATVLASFMLGLSLGSIALGGLSSKLRRPLLMYGVAESVIGAYALILIGASRFVQEQYVALAAHLQLSFAALTVLRFFAALLFILLPTMLMGGSLPLLVEGLKRRAVADKLNFFYGINTLGGAIGAVIAAYWMLPKYHIDGSLRWVFGLNLLVLAISAGLQIGFPGRAPVEVVEPEIQRNRDPVMPKKLVIWLAFYSGFITLANEVFWNHVLGLVIGTSTYAYAMMLSTTLLGMAAGSLTIQRLTRRRAPSTRLLAYSQILLGLSVMASVPFFDQVPKLFLQFGALIHSFAAMEALRFAACSVLLLPPAFCAGLTFPLTLVAAASTEKELGRAIGKVYAINTAGTVAGSLIAGFVILGWLGGHASLIASGLFSLFVGAVLAAKEQRPFIAVAWAAAGVALAVAIPPWNPKTLLSGANIYFSAAHDDFDEVVWQHEDLAGGVTSIIRSGKILTQLTNGKFQGNNGSEVVDQRRFALIPNLFVTSPKRALNIGLGTGTTLGVITRFPYTRIDVAELSRDIVDTSKKFFSDISFNALADPRVHLHLEDGRNYLLLDRGEMLFDLISIEITSIWFAGAGNLYNDEFYTLAKQRMAHGAVLQQWVQLHHMALTDIASILRTLRKHFRYVQLWLPSHQGIILASDAPLILDPARLAEATRAFSASDFLFGEPSTLLGELLLDTDGVDALLANSDAPLSTDVNLSLEYSTPKGNALGWNFDDNFTALEKFSAPSAAAVLPDSLKLDPAMQASFELGRSHFYQRYSSTWHRQIQRALNAVPSASDKAALRAKLFD